MEWKALNYWRGYIDAVEQFVHGEEERNRAADYMAGSLSEEYRYDRFGLEAFLAALLDEPTTSYSSRPSRLHYVQDGSNSKLLAFRRRLFNALALNRQYQKHQDPKKKQ